ncbi:MAG TPA: hydrogenase maturation protease [Amycolatopsis sp.]|nr:hydrogenase maturation protease [Amycolatopsis sp.]
MKTLIAGTGNVFLGDDGFGCEVARRLTGAGLPEGAHVAEFGISGMHLAYELLDGYDVAILVDATARGEAPGTLYVIEPRPGDAPVAMDAHGMQPDAVLGLVNLLGGSKCRVLVVGCEPADTGQGMGLSAPVEAAVGEAVRLVTGLAWQNQQGGVDHVQDRADRPDRGGTGVSGQEDRA